MILNEDFFDDVESSEIVSTEEKPDYENTIEEKYTNTISVEYAFNLKWLNRYREYIVCFVKKLNYVINSLSFVKNSHIHISGYKCFYYSASLKYPFDFGEELTIDDVDSFMKSEGTNVVLNITYFININKVTFKRFCSDIHKLYMATTYKNIFPKQHLVSFGETKESSDNGTHGFSPKSTMWPQDVIKEVYKFLYKEKEIYNLYDDDKYKKLFGNQTLKIQYLYYLHQIDSRVQIFKDFIVDIYSVDWHPLDNVVNNVRKLDIYMTVICMNDNLNKTGDVIDFVYKKFIKALKSIDKDEFINPNTKEGTVNFYVYTDPDIQPSKSVYTEKTIDVNSNVKKVSFEEITKTLEADNIKYTYNIEFVDKDWNMSKEQFDNLYRQHNKWKNMRF